MGEKYRLAELEPLRQGPSQGKVSPASPFGELVLSKLIPMVVGRMSVLQQRTDGLGCK